MRVNDLDSIVDPIERAAAADALIVKGLQALSHARSVRAQALREAITTGVLTRAELARARGISGTSLDRLMSR